MKQIKSSIIALALCVLCAGASAQTVSVADVEALPGETVAFTLDLTGGKADTYVAMQFDVQFPATGFSTTGDYSVSTLWKNATATIGEVDANGLATIPVASSESISTADVQGLLTVAFTVDNSVTLGDYEVTLKNIWLGYGTSSKDYPDDVTFSVHVVAVHNVVLDENSTTAPQTSTDPVNVRVLRTISANRWNTICLPFDMTEEQTKEIFGDDVQLAFFTSYDVEKDGTDVTSITINFEEDDLSEGFAGNYPYLIKTSKDITEFELTTTIDPDDVQESYSSGKGSNKKSGKFIGTYQSETEVPENSIVLSGNKFWYSTGLTKIKAFRAYFTLSDVLSGVEGASVKMYVSTDDNQTKVKTIVDDKSDSTPYDLSGRKVVRPSRHGIYIVNGKKTLVR